MTTVGIEVGSSDRFYFGVNEGIDHLESGGCEYTESKRECKHNRSLAVPLPVTIHVLLNQFTQVSVPPAASRQYDPLE
jgi:hypothetical protein